MPRRRKSSTADDIIHLVALMPWWAGLLLAGLSFVLLHHWSPGLAVQAGKPQAMHLALLAPLFLVAKYLVPFLCVVGAVVSVLRRQRRVALANQVAAGTTAKVLDGMSWQEFEMLVGEAYRQRGWQVIETGGGGADGGIDLVLRKHGKEKVLVQCKQWRSLKVGVAVVRELLGAMAAEGATGGIVVTSGRYTDEARSFARGRNIDLVDGDGLFAMLRQARQASANRPAEALPPQPTATQATQATRQAMPTSPAVPQCPRCAARMVRRTARSGARAGSDFWGCSTFPKCRGTA